MRRETAYKLAGRKHDNGAHHAASGVAKTREIRFKDFPPGQAAQAWRSLAALRGVRVEAGRDELVSGNTVVPLSKGWENNGLGGGPTFAPGAIVLNISNMDPAELVRLLEEWSSQNGPLPVVTIAAQAVA
jgi:hypothetical protein